MQLLVCNWLLSDCSCKSYQVTVQFASQAVEISATESFRERNANNEIFVHRVF